MPVEKKPQMTLRLCSICENAAFDRDKALAIAALQQAGLAGRVEITQAACLGACEMPQVLSLQGRGRASYVFSAIEMARDAEDLAQTCKLYLEAHKGWIKDARPCGRLRHKLRARIPALED